MFDGVAQPTKTDPLENIKFKMHVPSIVPLDKDIEVDADLLGKNEGITYSIMLMLGQKKM